MAISPSDFLVNASPSPTKIVVGHEGTFKISFSNINTQDTAYNLSLNVTLPDGVSYLNSSVDPDEVILDPSGTILLNFKSIKDLAPNELDYEITLELEADETFRSTGEIVPFDVMIDGIMVEAKVDTLPRGNDDFGNQEIIKIIGTDFVPLRYSIKKEAPGKEVKGAGIINPQENPLWVFKYEIEIVNNSREPSTVTIEDDLPNGVRYLDNLVVNGPDSVALSNPIVMIPSPIPGCRDFTTLDWGSVVLSADSKNTITFDVAIWDNFTENCIENSGDRIPHNTELTNVVTLTGLSGPVSNTSITDAKDILINKSDSTSVVDVGEEVTYTLNYRVNQYDDVSNVIIEDTLPDGQSYVTNSASIPETSVTVNLDGTTTIIWDIGYKVKGTSGSITFKSVVNSEYKNGEKVSAKDKFTNNVTITGINVTAIEQVLDSSSDSAEIKTPVILKSVLNYFYGDGATKDIDVAAPGDLVEFLISYSSEGIEAIQRNIRIDEYAPLNMGPLLSSISVIYGGTYTGSFTPVTVSPNGLRWNLGNVPGNETWTARFKVPVKDIEFEGTRNNLGKLAGNNIDGLAYSDRDLASVNFGIPNVELTKEVNGPNINAIKAGETYRFTINIANPENLDKTVVDAFQMDLQDVIPDNLTYVANSAVVSGSGIYTTPIVSGQNLTMTIIKLAPDESLTLTFDVTVDNTIVSGTELTNVVTLDPPYSQNDRSYQYNTPQLTDTANLKAKGITMTKMASPSSVKIGDTAAYILDVTIPKGTLAYNVKVVDNYKSATQSYIGNATKDGFPIIPVTPPPEGTVTFPTESVINAILNEVTIRYSFDVRVIDGTHVSPFIEKQINNATVFWDLGPQGPPASPFSVSEPLEVKTPNLNRVKNQRNVTRNGNFTSGTVRYDVGDIIEYRLTVTNNGKETAFDTVIIDTLNSLLSVPFDIVETVGIATYISPTITWKISQIEAGNTATLTFKVTTLPGIGSDRNILNRFSAVYNTNDNGFGVSYGPENSNTVRIRSEKASMEKEANLSVAQIGDDIEYTLKTTVPKGTVLYNVTIDDLLTVGQNYIGPATLQVIPGGPPVTITTSTSGNYRVFNLVPILPYIVDATTIDASTALDDIEIRIKFIARVISGTHFGTFTEIQTNTGRIRWSVTQGGSVNKTSEDQEDVTVTTPNIELKKEQSLDNISYTIDTIQNVTQGDTLYYKFTAVSNGAATAENIILTDTIDSNLQYVGPVGTPLGNVDFTAGVLTWDGFSLSVGNTSTLIVAFNLKNPVPAKSIIGNIASLDYDSNDVNPITYTTESNQVNIIVEGLKIVKTSDLDTVAVGDLVQYTIEVTIPKGIIAYNIEVQDVLPFEQQYDSFVSPPPTTASGNLVRYEDTQISRTGPETLTYVFNAKVIQGNINPPYTEIQEDTAEVNWRFSDGGQFAPPSSTILDITVNNPHINIVKEQRNVTDGGTFTTDTILVNGGEKIEYRLKITNDGASTAYTVITTDQIDGQLENINYVASSGSVTIMGNLVTWTLLSIAVNASETLIISGTAKPSVSGSLVTNVGSSIYKSNPSFQDNLGPEVSNEVSFNFELPLISKHADKQAVFSGDEITYTVQVTVPVGVIIYNAQFVDTLPTGQTYVLDSATEDGVSVTPVITGNILEFPQKPIIDASLGEVVIEYIFKVTAVSNVPQSEQINNAKLVWSISETGPLGPEIIDTEKVYVTNGDILLEKAQRNFTVEGAGPPYFKDSVIAKLGDTVLYEFKVTNTSLNTIYNVVVDDVLDGSLTYEIIAIPPTLGNIMVNQQNVVWVIPELLSNETARAVIAVNITGTFTEGSIKDALTGTFTATDTSPIIIYGPRDSNEVELNYPPLTIEKTVSTSTAEVGQIITYFVDINIPAGAVIYNFQLIDTLPLGQIYGGASTKDGVAVFPQIIGQKIIFDIEPFISADQGDLIIRYTIDSRVIDGNFNPPYTTIQINEAEAFWEIDTSGTKGGPISDDEDVEVKTAFFFIAKSQRNVTEGTSFTTDTIFVNKEDIVEYKLIAHNFGEANAYNVILTDDLHIDQNLVQFVSVPLGTTGKLNGNIVTWTIPVLKPNEVLSIIFSVEETGNIVAGGIESNIAKGKYDTNDVTPIEKTGFESNEVFHKYPSLEIDKTSNCTTAKVLDTVRYSVKVTIPVGTVAYNVTVKDTLPVNQSYVGNATLNEASIVPTQILPQIVFPIIPFVDVNFKEVELVYEFDVLIESANVDPVTLIEYQRNEAIVKWYFDSTFDNPADPINDVYELPVTDSKIKLQKLQRNAIGLQDFTEDTIVSSLGEEIEYKIVVQNIGPNIVYNIKLYDILSDDLKYIAPVSVPKGTLTHTGENFDGTVNYMLNELNIGETVEVIFKVKIIQFPAQNIINFTSGTFRANDSGKEIFDIEKTEDIEIKVINPDDDNLIISKYQKNVTKDGEFTKDPIEGFTGDIVEYKLCIFNALNIPIYDIKLIDNLSNALSFIGPVSVPKGTLTHTGEIKNGTVKYELEVLYPQEKVEIVFKVKVLVTPLSTIKNFSYGVYSIVPGGNIIPAKDSNIVSIQNSLESVCVITDKIFSKCQQRDCIKDIEVTNCGTIQKIVFFNGVIEDGSLKITPIQSRPSFYKIEFKLDIPYKAIVKKNGEIEKITGVIEDIYVETIMFASEARDEMDIKIKVNTESKVLNTNGGKITVGTIIIISLMYEVQLLIPSFGYCKEKCKCEKYKPDVPVDVCKEFLDFTKTPFPEDFFPPQYEDINCKI